MEAVVDLTLIEPSYEGEVSKLLEAEGIPACFGDMLLTPLFEGELLPIDELLATKISGQAQSKKQIDLQTLLPSASNVPGSVLANMYLTQNGYDILSIHKKDKINRTVAKAVRCVSCKVYVHCNMLTQNMLLYKISETKGAHND